MAAPARPSPRAARRRRSLRGGVGRRAWTPAAHALPILTAALLAFTPARAADVPTLWVEPTAGGAATLQGNGDVLSHLDDGQQAVLAHAVRGDSLRLCDGQLLGIDADGRLRSLTGPANRVGPAVSLHSRPACLLGGRVVAISADARSLLLLSPDLETIARRPLDALPDDDPVLVEGAVAVLSQPTQRYRHGILGDEIEAGAVTLLRQDDLAPIATYVVAAPAVIEQRRVAAFPAAGRDGMLLTRSTPGAGAGVTAIALQGGKLAEVASAPPIGTADRWLNLFAVAGPNAYAVRTPHLGGPLERFHLAGSRLEVTRYALGVTNHQLGSRNLDLALLLPAPVPGGVDVLALPSLDLKQVHVVACTDAGCVPELVLALGAPLSSNLAARWRGAKLVLYAGEADGALQSFDLDASLWQPPRAR